MDHNLTGWQPGLNIRAGRIQEGGGGHPPLKQWCGPGDRSSARHGPGHGQKKKCPPPHLPGPNGEEWHFGHFFWQKFAKYAKDYFSPVWNTPSCESACPKSTVGSIFGFQNHRTIKNLPAPAPTLKANERIATSFQCMLWHLNFPIHGRLSGFSIGS